MRHVRCEHCVENGAGEYRNIELLKMANGNCHQLFSIMEHNQQDPHYMGTVVFCGSTFPQLCQLGIYEVSLLMESYP